MENANNKKTYSISYEWNNGYDNCLPEEKYYNFGTLTDLCGMSIKDAMKSGGDVYISINCSNGGINNSGNVNCNCNCGGGGGGGNSTGENVITITNKLVGDGLYEIVIDASEKPNADVDVSFTVDSTPYMFTLRAGETTLNTGIKSNSEYSNVESVEYSTSDKNYKYSIVNNVKSGVFKVTYIVDNVVDSVVEYKYNEKITSYPTPEKEGYTFSGWDGLPEYMPDYDIKVRAKFTVNVYVISYYIDGVLVHSENVAYGSAIPVYTPEIPDNLTFLGWDIEIPETMPAMDLTVNGKCESVTTYYTITYIIDGEIVSLVEYASGDTVTHFEAPEKDGYTFNGWDNEPTVMPGHDVEVTGSYTANIYKLVYKVDGDVVSEENVAFGSEIVTLENPVKEGYTFSGWDNVPATMPSNDVEINGTFTINSYKLTYTIDGETVAEFVYEFGAIVQDFEAPEKEGFAFNGWDNEPDTMPAMDFTVTGSYVAVEPNEYTITYLIDGKVAHTDVYKVGDSVNPFEAPAKEGYSFSGWDAEIPSVMPERDIIINGSYTVNSYKLVYKVDGEVVSETDVEYGAEIVALEEPVKEGYTFSGWDNVPATMPADNVEINGTFTINSYKLVYKVDGEVVSEENIEFGAEIIAMEEPVKEGYTFSGWDNVPATMPANDVEINGTFTINSYNVNYIVDEKVIHTASYEFGATVTPFEAPAKEGYTFNGWDNEPAVMPAHDVNVEGSYSVNTYKLTYTIDGEVIDEVYYEFGAIVEDYKAPEKENHVFNGWDNEPDTMPAMDFTVTGSYTYVEPSQYTITYVIDGKVAKADVYKEGDTVVPFEAPAKEGYTFNGWDVEIPAVMPGENITIIGSYTANTYKVTYKVDGEEVEVVDVVFGTEINTIEEPVKEGYTFSGWVDVPTTMPAMDIEINGSFTINSYKLTYTIDGEVVFETDVEYNSDITPFEAPVKEGYTFNGWVGEPAVMPANDVNVEGSYTVNSYKLVYKVDGEVVSETDVEFGAEIVAMEEPVKEGYTFSGWDNVPATMPANDVEINGTFTVNSYLLTYVIDEVAVYQKRYNFGEEITPMEAKPKEGFEFKGWYPEVPETMPAMDLVVRGSYIHIAYTITYMIDGVVVGTDSYMFESAITPMEAPAKEGYTFNGWENLPSIMPSNNITVTGSYSVNTYRLTYTIDGEVVGEFDYEFGAIVEDYKAPEKENHVFNGWDNEPDTMPAMDFTVTGSYTYVEPSQYTITYVIDGKVVKADAYKEGDTVVPFEAPVKEGYTFNGWDIEIPSVMPGENITITGSYTTNIYRLVYKVDGEVISESDVEYGAEIVALEEPVKEGYTFSGWDNVPATMPAMDIEINGSFTINTYKITYTIDGEDISEVEYEFGASVTPFEAPAKEGHTFNGWIGEPVTMPAENVTVTGSYTINTYRLTYTIDGEVVVEKDVVYGSEIETIDAPYKEGYSFNGWDNEPDTMPAMDVTVTGSYVINNYFIHYIIDGFTVHMAEYQFGAEVTPYIPEEKEGYTFNGWDNEPSVMPAENISVIGAYSVNSYTITYMVDGIIVKTSTYEFGAEVTPYTPDEKVGYTFNGWVNEPTVMPAENIEVTGSYTVNSYTITYKIDDIVVNTSTYNFGETVATYIPEEKEGYTFKGWVGEPVTMPAENVEVTGSYEANLYTVTYKAGDEIVHTAEFAFGADVTPFDAPVKEGYTFNGWVGEPITMPAENVEVTGSYEVNIYVLTFVADGVEVDKVEYAFGATISPVEAPSKEGYSFVSWDTLPATMPADDITVTAVYKVNKYNLNYYINDELFETVKVDFGAAVVPLAYEAQYGYTFSGWNGVPSTMPSEDVDVYATETANEWTITFEVTGETSAGVVTAYTATYGSTIVAPVMPEISGYSFSWDNVPSTMPNNDVTVTGSYKVVVSEEAKVLYGSIQTSLYDEMTTDEILAAMTASGNVIDNVSVVETQEYSFPVYTPTVDFNPDNLDDDEFEAYEENYRYCLYFVIPRDISSFALIESGISDVTRFYFKDEKHQNFTIDGKVYDIWRMSNLNGTRKDLPISGMIADKYAYTLIVNN